MLRIPSQAVHHRIVEGLNKSGFGDLSLPHIVVLQYPGPDGVRPGKLAERAGMSKQAMNQLLRSLEAMGYVVRRSESGEGRVRVVRFTKRGHAAYARILTTLVEVEHEWSSEIGVREFSQLKKLLFRVWRSNLVKVPVG
jgi:DNA-binding MarR family transcriptional regulator